LNAKLSLKNIANGARNKLRIKSPKNKQIGWSDPHMLRYDYELRNAKI